MNDLKLIKNAIEGDRDALNTLLINYRGIVASAVSKYVTELFI